MSLSLGRRRPPPRCLAELQARAEALAGASLAALAAALGAEVPAENRRAKGWAGQLVEQALGADPLAHDRPDFPGLGVELKTVPVGPGGAPRESTFCCALEMASADQQEWATSRLRRRLACVLWVPVQGRDAGPLGGRRIGRAQLWRPAGEEEARLRADWELLMGQVGAGLAGEISARAGEVLQLRPKAAHSRVRTWAPGAEGAMSRVLPLGFYLRPAFTGGILARALSPARCPHAVSSGA